MSNEVTTSPIRESAEAPASAPPAPQPRTRFRWLRLSNVISLLLVIGLTTLGFFIWQGQGVFVTVGRNQAPFVTEDARPSPQDISQNAVILQEDFATARGSWRFSPPNQSSFYGKGLLLDDNIYNGEAWAQPGLAFDDFILKVDSRWVGGTLGGAFGIRIRKDSDTGEYLALYLHNNGRFTVEQQNRRSLTVHANRYDGAIKINGDINEIQIEASNNMIRFFVNGVYLGTFIDTLPEIGDIEFVAQKEVEGEAFMAGFDNLIVTHNFVTIEGSSDSE